MHHQQIAIGAPAVPADTLFAKWRGRLPLDPHRHDVAAALHAAHPRLTGAIEQLPFARFEATFPSAAVQRYNDVPPEAAALLDTLDEALRAPWLAALLLWHMARFDDRFAASGLPDEFALHYLDSFHRILDQIAMDPAFPDLRSDVFLKDLWIARVVMIPAFAQIWWPRSGVSASTALHAGVRAVAYLLRCGGRRPFMEGHTHDPMARGYWNEAGWGEALRLAALALPAVPQVRGAFGSAWFYDPAIQTVSPRITFAQDMQVGQGAMRMKVGSNEAAIANATATSPTRRRMMNEGAYRPTDYAIVWSRKALIARYGFA